MKSLPIPSRTRRAVPFSTLLIIFCCAIAAIAGGFMSVANPAAAQGDPCVSATTELRTDAAGDQSGAPAANQQLDIRAISIAENYQEQDNARLVFTIKTANLSPVPPNGVWSMRFTVGGTVRYVAMESDASSNVTYEYGTLAGNLITPGGAADAGQFAADGTIKITISNNRVGSPTAGQTLTAITGVTQTFVGAAGTGGSFASIRRVRRRPTRWSARAHRASRRRRRRRRPPARRRAARRRPTARCRASPSSTTRAPITTRPSPARPRNRISCRSQSPNPCRPTASAGTSSR